MTPEMPGRRGHLAARPRPAVARDVTPGLHQLNSDTGADALLYVALGIRPTTPASLVLLLHGGATAQHGRNLLVEQADDAGLVLLAPSSQAETWDILLGGYGPDVQPGADPHAPPGRLSGALAGVRRRARHAGRHRRRGGRLAPDTGERCVTGTSLSMQRLPAA